MWKVFSIVIYELLRDDETFFDIQKAEFYWIWTEC